MSGTYGMSGPEPCGCKCNPDMSKFTIMEARAVGPRCLVLVKYHNCENYEGEKILVFGHPLEAVNKAARLDPHFLEDGLSPFARFIPNRFGWDLGLKMLLGMLEHDNALADLFD